jgi:hypothetical protein
MITRLKTFSMIAATLLVGASEIVAQPMGAPAYRTDYYNNAAHQTLVGSIIPTGCEYDEFGGDSVNYRLVGTQTSYPDQELVGYCSEGNYNPV